ncbi:hypothetical protein BAE44_0017201 [Dichanthelium oligosanthes]|uniref:Uncharacterized protein n=1 Tax=Dichanthelium oligosanthes TaxID=888268 RepID=A0A1E5V9E8_9POAL|nr:hypothetical protein BAE44_0017201 [Dichanthelium oligosanthes]
MAPPRQPPELIADLHGEILLLLPPDDPASLVRASLVCKPWRRFLTDPAFHRRYLAIHGAPPLLGFLYDHYTWGVLNVPRFVSIAAHSPIPQPALGYDDWSVIDSRHGRVLFDIFGYSISLVVWDPLTGDHHVVPEPPIQRELYGAAVLCAVSGCNHLDCHGGPFLVVLMAFFVTGMVMEALTYSSEDGAWNFSAHRDLDCHIARKASMLIGDDIYFRLHSSTTVLLRYNLGKNCLSTMNAPASHMYEDDFALMSMEDGSLGFADIQVSQLCLWSRNVSTEIGAGWEQRRVIELARSIPKSCNLPFVVGFAEGAGIIFVGNGVGVFTIELKSERVRKISERGHYGAIFPFMSFYTKV